MGLSRNWIINAVPVAAVLLAAGFLTGTGSAEELWCRSLGADQGLSQNFVAAIAQDHDGFMWFGTLGGLNRWDGYEFESFSHVGDDPATLSDATVLTLHVDAQGSLWVGTAKGLDRYEPATRKFRRYGERFGGRYGADSQKVEVIASDRAGRIWFASLADPRVFRLDPRTGEESATVVPGGAGYWITALHVDRSDGLWVATQAADDNPTPEGRDYRLFVFDRCSEIGPDGLPPPREPVSLDPAGGKVWCVAEDAAGRLWFGRNGGGLLRLDPRAAGAASLVGDGAISGDSHRAGEESSGPGQATLSPAGTNSLALASPRPPGR